MRGVLENLPGEWVERLSGKPHWALARSLRFLRVKGNLGETMRYESVRVTWGRAFLASVVAALSARPAAALVVASKIRLSKDPGFNPLSSSLIADFTAQECDFHGYTAGGYAPTYSGTVNLGAGIIGTTANVLPTCDSAAAPSPNTCYGWWSDDTVNVIMGEKFANGAFFVFAAPGDYLDLQVSLPFGLSQLAA